MYLYLFVVLYLVVSVIDIIIQNIGVIVSQISTSFPSLSQT